MAKLKVAVVIDVFEDIRAGAERQVYEFLKRCDRERFEVFLAVVHQEDIPKEIRDLEVPARALGIKRIYDLGGLSAGWAFADSLKGRHIDVVLTYHFSSDIWGTAFAWLARVPVIVSSRRDIGFWRNKTHVVAYKMINRCVTKIIAVSGAVKDMVVREEGVAPSRVVVVHNGVELCNPEVGSPKAEVRKTLNIAEEDYLIGCVANFTSKTKGHEVLIEAIDKIVHGPQSMVHGLKVILVGDGPLRPRINLQVAGHRLEGNILFAGKRSDVQEMLQACDMCVLPSLTEGMSNALLEYMAAGKPVVATAVGGNPEVIRDRENGLLVPADDAQALAQAMLEIMKDQALAQRLGAAARKTVEERFDIMKQIEELQRVLEMVHKEATT